MSDTYEEFLWKYLSQQGIGVPLEVIQTWDENECKAAERYADDWRVRSTYGWGSNSPLPACLRPYIERKDKPYDGHGLAQDNEEGIEAYNEDKIFYLGRNDIYCV